MIWLDLTKILSRSTDTITINSSLWVVFLQGLDEEGLYRISGPVMAIDELKDEFEKSLLSHIYNICITYAVILKMLYYRESRDKVHSVV